MQRLYDREILEQFAYESWLNRGQPIGSPEIDWSEAEARFSREQDTTIAGMDGSAAGVIASVLNDDSSLDDDRSMSNNAQAVTQQSSSDKRRRLS